MILAAGNSTRFKENKLLATVNGKSMIECALEAVPAEKLFSAMVVTQYDSVAALAERFGYQTVINHHPEWGLSHSVKLGTEALKDDCDGILYQVADQPNLKRESISGMLDVFCSHPDHIVSMSSNGKRGNPCVFPKAYFDELCRLSGDKGGRSVIEHHEDQLILFEVCAEELADIDTPEDMIRR